MTFQNFKLGYLLKIMLLLFQTIFQIRGGTLTAFMDLSKKFQMHFRFFKIFSVPNFTNSVYVMYVFLVGLSGWPSPQDRSRPAEPETTPGAALPQLHGRGQPPLRVSKVPKGSPTSTTSR